MNKKHVFFRQIKDDSGFMEDTGEQQYTYINGLGFIPQTPQQLERKRLVFQYNILFFSILIFYFLRVACRLPVARLLSILGLDITVNPLTGLVMFSSTAEQVSNLLCYIIYMYLPAALILLFSRRSVSTKKIFALPYKKSLRYGLPILVGAALVAQMLSEAFNSALKSGGLLLFQNEPTMPQSITPMIIYLLCVTIVPAFFEEFVFRGVMLQSLRRFGDLVAIVVPAILFMLIQPSAVDMIRAFLFGMAFGYFTLRSGSIWVPMIANFAFRCLSVFCHMLLVSLPARQSSVIIWFLLASMMLLSLLAFGRFLAKDQNAFRIRTDDTCLTNRAKFKYLFANIVFWMVVIVAATNMIRYMEIIN